MWIFGAVDFTAALAKVAKVLGYRVDGLRRPRGLRHPAPLPDGRRGAWSRGRGRSSTSAVATLGQRDAVCILTHDPKFDVPAMQGALGTKVGYIGVMGSRTTHAKRMERLAEAGVTEPEQLDRLMSPIGLDIGARTPEETAISICAEIIARRTGRATPSLRDAPAARSTAEPVHRGSADRVAELDPLAHGDRRCARPRRDDRGRRHGR